MANSIESYLSAVRSGRSFLDPELSLVDGSPLEDENVIGYSLDYMPFDLSRIWFAVAAKRNRCWICRQEITFRRKADFESWDAIWEGEVEIPAFVFARLQRDVRHLYDTTKGSTFDKDDAVDGEWYVFEARWNESQQIRSQKLFTPKCDDSRTARRIISRIEGMIHKPRRFFEQLSIPLVGRILWWFS